MWWCSARAAVVAVVGAEGGALGAVLDEEGQRPGEIASGRALADEYPHAESALLKEQFGVAGLVIARGACDKVGGEVTTGDVGGVPVDELQPRRPGEDVGGMAGDEAHVVHGFAQSHHLLTREEFYYVGLGKGAGRLLEGRGRYGGG